MTSRFSISRVISTPPAIDGVMLMLFVQNGKSLLERVLRDWYKTAMKGIAVLLRLGAHVSDDVDWLDIILERRDKGLLSEAESVIVTRLVERGSVDLVRALQVVVARKSAAMSVFVLDQGVDATSSRVDGDTKDALNVLLNRDSSVRNEREKALRDALSVGGFGMPVEMIDMIWNKQLK